MIKIFTRIIKHEVRRSSKDRRKRVLWVVASYMGLDGLAGAPGEICTLV